MLKPMGNKILTILCSKILFISTYGIMEIKDPRYEGVFNLINTLCVYHRSG